jgi:hypothetical protein
MFADQISAYLQTVNTAATQTAYRRALEQFQAWYAGSYGRAPRLHLATRTRCKPTHPARRKLTKRPVQEVRRYSKIMLLLTR